MRVSRKMWVNLFILFTVFLLTTSCGPKVIRLENIPKDYSLDDTKKKGVFIVSLTHSGKTGTINFVHFWNVDHNLQCNVITIDRNLLRRLTKEAPGLDWKCPIIGKIPADKPCGRLIIAELPQGEYEFYSWSGTFREYWRGWIRPPKRFRVIAGKAVYLGNLHISARHKFTRRVPLGEFRYNIKIADKSERDLPLVYQKNPRITADKVVVNILK